MHYYEIECEENILHERLTLAEWHQNSDIAQPKISIYHSIASPSYFNPFRIFEKPKLDSKKYSQNGPTWQLSVSQDGKVIAIIQDTMIEIRTAKDDFLTVVGKAFIPVDQYPHMRRAQWSTDNSFLAIARDNGIVAVFNLTGCVIATVMPYEGTGNIQGNNANAFKPVAGLVFFPPRSKNSKWSNELYIFYNDAQVRSILFSSLDGCDTVENANCSLEDYFPQGIISVAAFSPHFTVILSGNFPSERDGLSVWKVLNEQPYVKIGNGFEDDAPVKKSFLSFFQGYSTKLNQSTVINMKICPRGHRLACLHYSGEISLWHYPGIRFIRRWPLSQQPGYGEINPQNPGRVANKESFIPVDICWWSDIALVIARKSGAVTICSLSSLNNLLDESHQFLLSSPQLEALSNPRITVLALECEIENNKNKMRNESEDPENETSGLRASIKAALYSFTDIERFEPRRKTPRILQRKYRLIALKYATPEELFLRKIEQNDYESALSLARSYNLDCDLVYQKQWRSSPITEESIYNILDKVKDNSWVVNECLQRVPDTPRTARDLLEFGLQRTDLACESFSTFTSEQRKIIPLRRQLLSFLDNLSLYMKIIPNPSKYNAVEYDRFRRKSALMNTVDLARQENWLAVTIMFTYKGNSIIKYWLPILSNFPETLCPLHYRSLLPEVNKNDVVVWNFHELRIPDWSENVDIEDDLAEEEVSKDYIYHSDRTLKQYEGDLLVPGLVSRWYLRRVYEIEKNTGLVENAYLFACLGKERNVKSLDTVLFHLRTLYTLVYTVQDFDISLSKLESLPAGDQAKLFFSQTTKETFIKDLNGLFYPFAKRYEKRGVCTFYSLLHGLLLWLGKKSLELPLKFFQATKVENALAFKLSTSEIMRLAIRCIYNCKEPNQLENDYSILECLPARTTSEAVVGPDLHNTIDKMENHLQVCEILQQYRIHKPVIWVVENKENRSVARQIMQQMANYTRDVTQDYTSLQYDLQQLQSYMFTSYDLQYCYELVACTQLNTPNEQTISLARNLLQSTRTDQNKLISFGSAVELVVVAARRHFERAHSYDDPAIKLARLCLSLIREPHKLVKEQIDLIEGLRILKDFGVKVLPMQVRNCRKKVELIEQCLEQKPSAYRSKARLLQLADCLRIHGSDQNKRECSVILLLARHALKMNDYDYCYQMCNQLVTRRYPPAWSVARDLTQINKRLNHQIQQDFLAFAIMYCPKEELQNISQFRRNLRENFLLKQSL